MLIEGGELAIRAFISCAQRRLAAAGAPSHRAGRRRRVAFLAMMTKRRDGDCRRPTSRCCRARHAAHRPVTQKQVKSPSSSRWVASTSAQFHCTQKLSRNFPSTGAQGLRRRLQEMTPARRRAGTAGHITQAGRARKMLPLLSSIFYDERR